MPEEPAAHSMCVSLRLDPATLKAVDSERADRSLSATMNAQICGVLSVLAKKANNEDLND